MSLKGKGKLIPRAGDWRVSRVGKGLIPERTRAGVKASQRRGVKLGRMEGLTPELARHARTSIDKGEAANMWLTC